MVRIRSAIKPALALVASSPSDGIGRCAGVLRTAAHCSPPTVRPMTARLSSATIPMLRRFSTQCERFVLAGCQPENREQTAVFCEPGSVGRLAARHLCELGHQSLACVSFNIAMDHDQVHGFAEVARADEATVTAWQVPHSESAGKEERDSTFAEWLAALPRPTGLFVTDDRFAANICELAREMAIGVPDDLAVIAAAHDPNAAALSRPTLSFVEYPWQEVGYQAAALLADLLEGESSGRQVVISPHNVVHCRSTFTLAVEDDKVPFTAVDFIRSNRAPSHRCSRCFEESAQLTGRSSRNFARPCAGRSWMKSVGRACNSPSKCLLTIGCRLRSRASMRSW